MRTVRGVLKEGSSVSGVDRELKRAVQSQRHRCQSYLNRGGSWNFLWLGWPRQGEKIRRLNIKLGKNKKHEEKPGQKQTEVEGKPVEYVLGRSKKIGFQEGGPWSAVSQLHQRCQNGYGLRKVQLVQILYLPHHIAMRKSKPRTQINFMHLFIQ